MSSSGAMRKFLSSAFTNPEISAELRDLASSFLSHHSSVLKSIWLASDPKTRPDLLFLFSGSEFVFTSPNPREKSAELRPRLKKLYEAAERKAYHELVKDVAPKRRVEDPFSDYKDQIGFGIHVVLIMFTGYFYTFRALFTHNIAMTAAGGILGLVIGMLVETLPFIITTSTQIVPSVTSTSSMKQTQ